MGNRNDIISLAVKNQDIADFCKPLCDVKLTFGGIKKDFRPGHFRLVANQIAANRRGNSNHSVGGQSAGGPQANGATHTAAEQSQAVPRIGSVVDGLYGCDKISAACFKGGYQVKFALAAAAAAVIEAKIGNTKAVALSGQGHLFG